MRGALRVRTCIAVDVALLPSMRSLLDLAKLQECGVNRFEGTFWENCDWFQNRLNESDPMQAGLYDLNRYFHLAPPATARVGSVSRQLGWTGLKHPRPVPRR